MANDIVEVQITIDNVGVARQGYGMPLIVSHNVTFDDRVKFYASTSEATEADVASDSPEALALSAFFAQSPKPPLVAIGRADGAKPTKRYAINVPSSVGAKSTYAYVIEVKGEGVTETDATYTSDASASIPEVHSGLVTALNAVVGKNYTAAFAALAVADFTFTAEADDDTATAVAHGLETGDGPFQVSNSGGALPTGLAAVTDYWIIRTGANTFQFASSLANALAGTAINLTTDGTGTQTIADTVSTVRPSDPFTVTGDAPGEWFSLALAKDDVRGQRLYIHENHASPAGLADELDAILDEDSSWYQVHTMYNSEAYCTDVAAWAEENERTYVPQTNDTDVLNVAVGSGTDFGAEALDAAYTATSAIYARDPSQFAAARWMGRWLPTDPGQATAALKTVVGLDTESLTGTQRTNLKNRRMQTYRKVYGRGVVTEGMVFSTVYRYLDVRRDIHWFIDEIRRGGFELLAGSDKVPYTPNGTAKVEGMLRGTALLAEAKGVFSEHTTAVEMPEFEDIVTADKEARVYRRAKVSGTLSGAIHSLIPVLGTISF